MQQRLNRPRFLHFLSSLAGLEKLSDTQFITPLLSLWNFGIPGGSQVVGVDQILSTNLPYFHFSLCPSSGLAGGPE